MNDGCHSLFREKPFTLVLASHSFYAQVKILQSTGRGWNVAVINDDGASILRSLHVDNPAVKVLVVSFHLNVLLNDRFAAVTVNYRRSSIIFPDLASCYSSYLIKMSRYL